MNETMMHAEPATAAAAQPAMAKKRRFMSVKMAIIIAIVLIVAAVVYLYRGLFVVAMVNGHPISRIAVVRELEKRSGKQALESLITERLIEGEMQKNGITVPGEEIDQEIKTIQGQLTTQGTTLEAALASQSMSLENLRKQITIRKSVEKILADKTKIGDDEVEKYIKDNKMTPPKGKEGEFKTQIKQQLTQQKFSQAADQFVSDIKAKAKIRYFVNY